MTIHGDQKNSKSGSE